MVYFIVSVIIREYFMTLGRNNLLCNSFKDSHETNALKFGAVLKDTLFQVKKMIDHSNLAPKL